MNAEKLKQILNSGAEITEKGKIVGKGIFETDLLKLGYSKSQLKRLALQGGIKRKLTFYQSAARAIYINPV